MKFISRRDFIKKAALTTFSLATINFFDADAAEPCKIRLRQGIYDGFIDKHGVKTWLGIPYAQSPVKNLRLHAPQPLEPSNKLFSAKKFGFSPLQAYDPTEFASALPQNENCLTLNIWTRSAKNNLPVMVYIPGGGFVGGGSADPLYNGAHFAANQDVLIVTINYRLNIFGFMNFAEVDSNFSDSGYLGIKDQIAALTWVKENILNFGGDPNNVTIFGESAGAASIMLLMVTPAAQGLFKKAISQSGHVAFYHTPEQSANLAQIFMEIGGYKNMHEIMTTPAKKLLKTYEKLCEMRPFATEVDYFPTCDGKFLPKHPLRALKDGAARDIKLMTGNTAEEYRYWNLYSEDFSDNISEFHARITPVIYESKFNNANELYQAWKMNHAGENYLEFADQLDWRVGQELAAEYQANFNDTFLYLFKQKSPNELLGSCHAIDLPFIFGNPSNDIDPNPDANLIKKMQESWYMFAETGNPSNNLIPTWKKYTKTDRETMEIDSVEWNCRKNLNADNLNQLRGVYEHNLLD